MPEAEGSVPEAEGSVPEAAGSVPEGSAPEGSAPDGSAPEGSALEGSDEEPLPSLQEEFSELTPELQQSMFGKPAQAITGLLIGVLVLVALLIGLTTLAKDGAAPGPFAPAPTASPSGSSAREGLA